MMATKVEFTQLYLYQEKHPQTLRILVSCVIEKPKAVWPMKQEPYLPPLLELLQKKINGRCLFFTTGASDPFIYTARFSVPFHKTG